MFSVKRIFCFKLIVCSDEMKVESILFFCVVWGYFVLCV